MSQIVDHKVSALDQALQPFLDSVADPYKTVRNLKQRYPGKKVIGVFPMHLPPELFHAAGVLPVFMWESNEPITLAHSHITPDNCSITRSVIDDALKGKLDMLDGLVVYHLCLQGRAVSVVVGKHARPPFMDVVYLPAIIHPGSASTIKPFVIEAFDSMRKKLGELTGHKISDEALRRSIQVYNKNRAMLRRVYELRRQSPGLLKGRAALALVWSSMLLPVEEHTGLLEKLMPLLEAQARKHTAAKSGLKVVVAGQMCFAPRPAVLDLIEDMGATIVDDDLFTGRRFIANDANTEGDPMQALADRYFLRTPPCPTKVDWEMDWSDYLADLVKESGAKGVVHLLVKFCPPHLTYYPDVKRKLDTFGIPEVLLETEHEMTTLEQARTRLQTFVETFAEPAETRRAKPVKAGGK